MITKVSLYRAVYNILQFDHVRVYVSVEHAPNKLHLLSPSPHPTYNVGHFSRVSTLYGGGGGGRAETNFEKETSAFSISVFKTQIIHAMAQVFQGILSTIVDLRYTIGL